MKRFIFAIITAITLIGAGCTRIESGEVGLRVGFDKQIKSEELQAGSLNQTLIGEVLTFPVREIAMNLDNKTPQTADNSTLKDADLTVVYNITPSCVSELWTTKSRSFHGWDANHKDWILMYNRVSSIANNALYKAVRKHEALKVADARQLIERDIVAIMGEEFKSEKLEACLSISSAQLRSLLPADDIVASANAAVKALNDLKVKTTEVETAKKEAERIAALNSNAKAIEYMNAQAQLEIARGIAAGKVQTIVVPYDFKGIVNTGK